MKGEKRCPHCGEWTVWNHLLLDRCTHCNELLQHEEIAYEENRAKKRKQIELDFNAKWPFHVKPTDGLIIKVLKQTGFGIFSLFMGIISLIAWIMFWIAS